MNFTGKPQTQDPTGNIYASKSELLDWVNTLLELQLIRLEQFASGAVFCQLLDAYFKDTIALHKVNFHAKEEYESTTNYKILQTGFTALHLTRDINVTKLSRGSKVDTLELLQYLYKYLLKKKALENYNGRERRALTVKGGTDAIPIPAWMANSFDSHGNRATGRNTSGNWSIDPQQSLRAQLRPSGSFQPAATSRGSIGGAGGSSGMPGGTTMVGRRPCAPVRLPSASPVAKQQQQQGQGQGQQRDGGHEEPEEERDNNGVQVYQVVCSSDGLAAAARPSDSLGAGVSRLVVDDEALAQPPQRPLSPGSRSLLTTAVEVVSDALGSLTKAIASMRQVQDTLGCSTDSYSYRGKVRSMQDASATLVSHLELLLTDLGTVLGKRSSEEVSEVMMEVMGHSKTLSKLKPDVSATIEALSDSCAASSVATSLFLQMTAHQKQITNTAALDGALKALGTVHASLVQRLHKEASAAAGEFLDAGGLNAGAPGEVMNTKVLKLGDDCMKRLRNGDIYRGKYSGSRKNGNGMYSFINLDVYEGEFKEDRMAGVGVYTFYPEGRYEGEWKLAVYDGAGSETFAKGSTYHGEYAGGLRHGWGTCRFHNGDFYEGQWHKGLRDGVGMQQCTDDSNYLGDYQKGKRHGYGVYSFPNGDQYLGEYEDDIPTGYGTYIFGSGQKYEGHWEHGKKHGWSIYTVETGQRWAGSWTDGKPQWVQPLAEGAAAADLKPEESANMSHALAAAENAQKAARAASQKAAGHWQPSGDVQQGLMRGGGKAAAAAAAAQAARARAQQLAACLDTAALLVEEGNRGAAGMLLVA